jgi:hypothetical protein
VRVSHAKKLQAEPNNAAEREQPQRRFKQQR